MFTICVHFVELFRIGQLKHVPASEARDPVKMDFTIRTPRARKTPSPAGDDRLRPRALQSTLRYIKFTLV